ncbi:hypothetical protein CORC01_14219 [Colletotrichum orchidophilum]|uniref:Aminoglycoside phosphotransferase domain-containing protein n=1 Tax=Colletotrichum orchidophilum TaxID=1209926 RepID=A0A1G4AMZ1_9PEZI|nr:uncharacterized protein CORC01_14219 [Colletotrichum orchidophilum]OHE90491.1 hypothetical protein CORC01_14219 [Colletotrichum orchidophilum]
MRETEPINAGRLAGALTLSVVWIRTNQYFRRLWKPQTGLLSAYGFCIKVKPYANLAEAHTVQFVAQCTSIPVPKVYSAFVHQGTTYIVMRKINGQMVWLRWKERPEASKRRILDQLHGMVF